MTSTRTSLALSVLYCWALVACGTAVAVKKRLSDSEQLLMRLEAVKRVDKCTGPAGKCFNTAHCCSGLICAAFDEQSVDIPEVPGNCVKSKDLQACSPAQRGGSPGGEDRGDECPPGSECVALGRAGQNYCVQETGGGGQDANPAETAGAATGLLGLGAACESSKDCAPTSDDRSVKLCCQQVRRGRQGIKQLCDRVTFISVCI